MPEGLSNRDDKVATLIHKASQVWLGISAPGYRDLDLLHIDVFARDGVTHD
ncbi:hypothetical protein [Streptacidiphilus anmyonensis]|uniref:hypothetical protein n=1 Tax=Streptacidiphilus anmyonensis TaxID=405782 RepID=UPI0013648CF3|nr:hypothetical protein [Streptacidiphilus anmyonensis]